MSTQNESMHIRIKEFDKLLKLFESASIGLWEMDSKGVSSFFNKSFYERYGVTLGGSILDEWMAIIHPDDRKQFEENVNLQIDNNINRFVSEYRVKRRDGTYSWIEANGLGTYDDNNELIYMVGSHTDITDRKIYERNMNKLAYCDKLTDLYNRAKLVDLLTESPNSEGSIIYMSLDNFKLLNDTYGFDFGNNILIALSQNIREVFKTDFTHFRLSSAEFAVLTDKVFKRDELKELMNVLNESIRELISFEGTSIDIKISAGICMLSEPYKNVEDLILKARLTMRYAKKNMNDKCAFYDDEIQRLVQRELHIKTGLLQALNNNELYLNYQPILDAKTGKIESFEALIRWKSPTWGNIYPDQFIDIAEKTQDIIAIGYFVIRSACKFINMCKEVSERDIIVSVNVSVVQLLQHDFADRILEILTEEQVSTCLLNIEVTESLMLDNQISAINQIRKLSELGFEISLDDFGSGYSSLYNLFTLPIKKLKIDRRVMNEAMVTDTIYEFVSSVAELCHKNNILIVAEGIENIEMVYKANQIDIDLFQGYLYSKPVAQNDAIRILELNELYGYKVDI